MRVLRCLQCQVESYMGRVTQRVPFPSLVTLFISPFLAEFGFHISNHRSATDPLQPPKRRPFPMVTTQVDPACPRHTHTHSDTQCTARESYLLDWGNLLITKPCSYDSSE